MAYIKKGIGSYEITPEVCPKCEAPTLDQTNTREDCDNCGYWLIFATGEGWVGLHEESNNINYKRR